MLRRIFLLLAMGSSAFSQIKFPSSNASRIYNAASWDAVDVPGGGLAPGSEFRTLDVPWFVSIGSGSNCPKPDGVSITVKPVDGETLVANYVPTPTRCAQVHGIFPAETPLGPADISFSISGNI